MKPHAALLVLVLCVVPRVAAAAVPEGFQEQLVASVASPTGLAFTPDGRLLIITQSGKLWVHRDGALLPNPAIDLAARLCTNSERGLLGVAVDPAFSTNRFVYLFYTFNRFNACSQNSATSPVNRVSRFTLADTNSISPSSELVLLDNIPSPNGNHNGGDLHIGRDGLLYVSVGDGGCDYRGDSGCQGANDAARDLHVVLGKILRTTTTGGIPSGNPYRGSDSVRCGATGVASPGQKCQETFAWGLRNPFRIAFDPNAAGTRFFINDVGQNAWEEINEGRAGADYGWSVREGHCANGSTTNCGAPPAGMVNPIYDYAHANGCASITGGAFVPNGVWPAEFDGSYLFSDYVCGAIFRITPAGNGTYTRTTFASGLGNSSAVTLLFGPWEGSQALYFTTFAGGGQVRRIVATSNHAPVVRATATPRSGPAPLSVRFDASASTDADGDALTFEWNFGDGMQATGAVVTHTYSVPQRYSAAVTVRDGRGGSASTTIVIDAGNSPPVPTITSPSATARFAVGQTITLTGSAVDAEEGTLPASRLSWSVLLHHDAHTHPFVPPTAGNNITFQAPAPEDLPAAATSYLEIIFTATDAQGAASTTRRDVQPRKVRLAFETVPAGLPLTINGAVVATPLSITSWENYRFPVAAATQRDATGQLWLFASWSDGGAASHQTVTPAADGTLRATFMPATAVAAAADAYVRGGAYASQNFGTAAQLLVKEHASADLRRRSFLRFALTGPVPTRAVLRLRGALHTPDVVPIVAYPVVNTSWSETGITWVTQPPAGSTPLATVSIASTTVVWHEWDVTSYVRAERAAGRTAVAFMLAGAAPRDEYPAFASREAAAADRPALLLGDEAVGEPSGDIVLRSSDVAAIAGTWQVVADSTAADGQRMATVDRGAAKLAAPLASPANYVELSFTAQAGQGYHLWMRGKAERNDYANDSAYVQFSNSTLADGTLAYRLGTTSATTYVLEDCSGCAMSAWGWQDNGYGAGVLGPLIYFATTGPQRIRIQTREDGLSIDQLVLSPATYLTKPPGALRNDNTIVPR